MVFGVLLGAVQVAGGPDSWAYLYHFTNPGAVGFFANQNHMATLLLVSIPLGAALLGSAAPDRRSSAAGRYAIATALLGLVLFGVILNHSLAALVLVLPVLLASYTLVPMGGRWRRVALPATGVALVAAVTFLALNPITSSELREKSTSVTGRSEIWKIATRPLEDAFPFGTGLGSFEQVYRQYENPQNVNGEYVNHAHNDYLELAIELGLPGVLLVVLYLAWWSITAVRIWRSKLATRFARAATIVTAAVLAHSFVDFPLRTAAIAVIFGAMTGVMAQPLRMVASAGEGEARGARHVSLG
jgi:O-antigen ligase